MVAGAVLGQAVGLARLALFVDAIAEAPRAVVLEGDAGIGKTALWSAAIGAAAAREGDRGQPALTVLSARAVEAERDLANVVLTDLLGTVAPAVLPHLPAPQAGALAAALLLDGSAIGGRAGADPRAIGTAILGVFTIVSRERPVLLAIDDLPWVDPASAAALEFALRRVTALGLPVGLLVTRRSEPLAAPRGVGRPSTDPGPVGRPSTERVLGMDATVEVLQPVSLGVLHQLVRERTGVTLTRPQVVRLEQASGGNPMLAIEIGRELARLDRWPLPGEPLPVPADTRALVAGRLERLSPAATEVLFVTAASSAPTISSLAATLQRPVGEIARIVAEVVEQGLLAIDPVEDGRGGAGPGRDGALPGRGGRVRAAHPLIAAAALDAVPAPRRRALHARAADLATSDEDRGRHLVLATEGPDPRVADALDTAAVAARRRGALAVAAAWADAAADMSDPSTPDLAVRRRFRAARWWTESGDVARGRTGLEALVATLPAGDLRAQARAILAQVAAWDGGPEAMLPLAEASLAEARDPELRARIRLRMASAADHLGPMVAADHAAAAVRELRISGARATNPDLLACALLQSASLRYAAGLADDEAAVQEAVTLLADDPRPSPDGDTQVEGFRAHELVWTWADDHDRFDEAIAQGRRDIARARDHGLDRALPIVESEVALLLLRMGDRESAAEHAEAAMAAAEMSGNQEGRRAALSARAALASARGDLEHSDALVAEALPIAGPTDDWLGVRVRVIQGATALARGDAAGAAAILGEVFDEQHALGLGETLTLRFAGDLVEAAVASGDLARARTTVATLEDSTRTRPRPWVRLMAARGKALVAAAEGDLDEAARAIAEALDHGTSLGMPFERARTELIAGRIERRRKQRRRAGEHLERAVAGFRTLGAAAWLAIAEAEAARLGRRAGGGDALTETELRVATLAARGLTNREVGEAAFLTPKSVEGVLARAYQKLGIRSRAELGAWLAGPSAGPSVRASAGHDSGIPPFQQSGERD